MLSMCVIQGCFFHTCEFPPTNRTEAGEDSQSQLCLLSEDSPSAGEPRRTAGGGAYISQPLLRLSHVAPETKVTDSGCQRCNKFTAAQSNEHKS